MSSGANGEDEIQADWAITKMRHRVTTYITAFLWAAFTAVWGVGAPEDEASTPQPLEPSRPAAYTNPASSNAAQALSALTRGTPYAPPLVPPSNSQSSSNSRPGFPELPPDPYAQDSPSLPPLHAELYEHGGSYLYTPEGDRLNDPGDNKNLLRLPEDWVAPEPITFFSEFLGADPIVVNDNQRWFHGPYVWDPQFVAYGRYELFGASLEQGGRRQAILGQQLEVELDLRLTGTERFHVQFRPIGDAGTGGSYYQFTDPEGYVDNSTAEPQRYWFEGELHSIFGAYLNPFVPNDVNIVIGRFPFALHNSFLMNDEIQGVVLSKNTIFLGDLSNLNVQAFYGFSDVDTFSDADAQTLGVHLSADRNHVFYEATYAYVLHDTDSSRNTHFAALSRTQFLGSVGLAARALFKWGDEGGQGSGRLFVLEANRRRYFTKQVLGVESAVFYCNAFAASQGWNSIGGGNFNRVRTAFEVNPVVRLAAGPANRDTVGVALGSQLFRNRQDESWIPEVAFEAPGGTPVWGLGLRYQRKLGPRTFIEVLGVANYSDDPRYERDGVFASWNLFF